MVDGAGTGTTGAGWRAEVGDGVEAETGTVETGKVGAE
jgi:hypothetical protein